NPEPGQAFSMTLNLGFRKLYEPGTTTIGPAAEGDFSYTASYNAPTLNPPGQTVSEGNVSTYSTRFNGISASAGSHSRSITVSGDISITCYFGVSPDPSCPPGAVCCPPGNPCLPPPVVESKPFVQTFRGDVIAGAPIFGNCTP